MNVEKARFDRILASEEIKQLIAALGCGIGNEEFDVERLRYHKIIIMTDADVDGAHIRTLLLTFFYRQMFPLIQGGYVYIGQPPLYRLGRGKQEKYFLEEGALNNYLFSEASEKIQVFFHQEEELVEIEKQDVSALLEKLNIYQRIVSFLNRLNIWEEMLYFLLENNVRSADQFTDAEFVKQLTDKLSTNELIIGNIRSCRWRPDCYEVDIALRGKVQVMMTLGPEIPLIKEYRTALNLFDQIKRYIKAKFKIVVMTQSGPGKEIELNSWDEFVSTMKNESFKGSHLQRYKGLGEMNPEQLWETTMNPANRVLVQVAIEDAEEADEIFTTLMGDKVEPRRDFIQNHALEVTELDI
jgi:DNA gyrase subunit B